MAKFRVYEIAKKYNKDNKEILEILKANHVEVKNHMSTIGDEQIKMCKLWSKFSKYISSCCLYDLCHLSFSSYNVSTNFSMVCLSALFRSFPSTISAPGTDGCNSLTVFPNPLPPDVANKTIFFPLKS